MAEETFEEAAERILANNIDGLRDALKDDDLFFFYKGVIQCYGEAMAEWQAERIYKTISKMPLKNLVNIRQKNMYSEEEMYNIIKMCCSMKEGERSDIEIIEYFEQFKKK